jgi:hypothetical protein
LNPSSLAFFGRRSRIVTALLLFSCATHLSYVANAAEIVELRSWRDGAWLVADVRAVAVLDERTRSTIESGLPGTLGLFVILEEEGVGTVAQRVVQRSLELDLWGGTALLREGEREHSFYGLAAADSAWSRFDSLKLVRWAELAPDRRYRVSVGLRVRPLGAEDRERVSRWVSRREDGGRRDVSLDVGGLLRHFMGRAAADDDRDAVRDRTEFFRLADLLRKSPDP